MYDKVAAVTCFWFQDPACNLSHEMSRGMISSSREEREIITSFWMMDFSALISFGRVSGGEVVDNVYLGRDRICCSGYEPNVIRVYSTSNKCASTDRLPSGILGACQQ